MRRTLLAGLAAGALLASGCWTVSLHPLYLEEDALPEPGLEGVWGDSDDPDGETWQFLPTGGAHYQLIVREKNELLVDPSSDGLFEVHLVRLDGELFADFVPETIETVPDYYEAQVIRAHSFARLVLQGHVLRVSLLDDDWLKEGFESGRLTLPHTWSDDRVVLTAPTEELRAFISDHAWEAFGEGTALYRLQ